MSANKPFAAVESAEAAAPGEGVQVVAVPADAGLHGNAALLAMLGIMAVILLASLDQTIVGTALPRVVAELGGFEQYAWVATSYLLTSTIMVPIMGKIGDLYGRKPFLLAAVVVFVGASALAGAAQSMLWLIGARGIQGIGAGMLQATAFTSVGDMFPQPERRARWQGLITSTFGVASVVGPSLGGVLTDTLGWRSVFYVNLPIGVLAFGLIWSMLPANLSPRSPNARIDWAGAATITITISSLLLAVEWGGQTLPWSSPQIIGLLLLALVALALFFYVERRAPEPLMPLDLFANRTVLLASMLSLLIGFVMFTLVYYTPLLFQGGLSLTPSQAGALQTPLAVCTALGSLSSGQIFARRRSMKPLMLTGASSLVLGTLLLLNVGSSSNPYVLSAKLALTGIGVGMNLPLLTILVQSVVPRARLGVGTAMIQFLRLIGSTLGTAVVGAAVNSIYRSNLAAALPAATDERLTRIFDSPQALIDPRARESLSQIAAELGEGGAALVDSLRAVAAGALISGVRLGYILGLAGAVAVFVLVILLPVPDYHAVAARANDDVPDVL